MDGASAPSLPSVALVGRHDEPDQTPTQALTHEVVFASNRTKGTGVNNPTGDYEVFKMNPDGTGLRQLIFNQVDDARLILSPDGKQIAYVSEGIQISNPEGDQEIYRMSSSDGSGKKNLSDNGAIDYYPDWGVQAT